MPLDLQQVPARKCGFALDKRENVCYSTYCSAGVAHLVERHLAKVEVASSSLVARSIKHHDEGCGAFLFLPKGKGGQRRWSCTGQRGILFRKREYPFLSPRERLALQAFGSKGCTRCAVEVRCTWLCHESSVLRYRYQPRALRSARVTLPRRRTAVRAAALLRSPRSGLLLVQSSAVM